MSLYKLPSFSSVDDFLQKIALIHGKLKKGVVADTIRAARIVLHDWNEGKIPYYTLPPTRNEGRYLESAIVPAWGKEFDVNKIYGEESTMIDSLRSMIDTSHFEMPVNCPLSMDTQLAESDEYAMEEADEATNAMGMDTNEIVATKSQKAQSQNDKLYDAEGIFNPHAAKSEKKQRKKARKVPVKVSNDVGNDNYDFAVDYKRHFIASQREAESDKDDDDENINNMNNDKGTTMAGVELDA